MPNEDEWVEVEGELVTSTDKAILIETDYDLTAWIPKSQIEKLDSYHGKVRGDWLKLSIPEWLAREKDLDYAYQESETSGCP